MRIYFIPALVFIVAASSCSTPRYVYSPTPPNNPFFTEKGTSKLSAYYSAGEKRDNETSVTKTVPGKNQGFDLQGAYAVSDHWALTASFSKRKERDTYSDDFNFFDSSIVNYKRKLFEFGGGYFGALNKNKSVYFNFFAGIGFGKSDFTDMGIDNGGLAYSRVHSAKVTKWFFQPAFNFITGDYFRFSFIGKFSFARFNDIATNYTPDEQQYFGLYQLDDITHEFFEPTVNFQVGVPQCPWLKFDFGFTFGSDPMGQSYVESRKFNASLGLSVDFSKMKTKAAQ